MSKLKVKRQPMFSEDYYARCTECGRALIYYDPHLKKVCGRACQHRYYSRTSPRYKAMKLLKAFQWGGNREGMLIPKESTEFVRRAVAMVQWCIDSGRVNYLCALCESPIQCISQITIDHDRPISNGGTHDLENLSVMHKECNQFKGQHGFATARAIWKERAGR